MVLLLGDRYETLAVACAAVNARIPIAHMHGGEITEGAVDDAFRHAITKMSYLHFTSTEAYRRRVIQLGEDPERVFAVGSTGVENIENAELFSRDNLSDELDMDLSKDYAVVTFHPVTLENYTAEEQANELLGAIDEFPKMNFIITKANADQNGRIINSLLEGYAVNHSNVKIFDSLGMKRYLSALKYARMVIGLSTFQRC
jgi:GDP/UDP-N,N'-diacetylbacillosamine 2-epimerase (hydrolysing)